MEEEATTQSCDVSSYLCRRYLSFKLHRLRIKLDRSVRWRSLQQSVLYGQSSNLGINGQQIGPETRGLNPVMVFSHLRYINSLSKHPYPECTYRVLILQPIELQSKVFNGQLRGYSRCNVARQVDIKLTLRMRHLQVASPELKLSLKSNQAKHKYLDYRRTPKWRAVGYKPQTKSAFLRCKYLSYTMLIYC